MGLVHSTASIVRTNPFNRLSFMYILSLNPLIGTILSFSQSPQGNRSWSRSRAIFRADPCSPSLWLLTLAPFWMSISAVLAFPWNVAACRALPYGSRCRFTSALSSMSDSMSSAFSLGVDIAACKPCHRGSSQNLRLSGAAAGAQPFHLEHCLLRSQEVFRSQRPARVALQVFQSD